MRFVGPDPTEDAAVSTDPLTRPARENIREVRDLEAELARSRTGADRLTDAVVWFAGSFRFLLLQSAVVLGWATVNLGLVAGLSPFDPFPFPFLNFAIALEAILLSTFVLMTQNRQRKEADHWGHVQLQVSLLAEQETTKLLEMVAALSERLGVSRPGGDPEVSEMVSTTHVGTLAQELAAARRSTNRPAPG
jgi:uncharacterized membrane protein